MATIRNITKQLAGMEDIVQGQGTINQTRNDVVYTINKVDTPFSVLSIAAMQALDIDVYTRARVYSTNTDFIDYIYDPLATSGITPDVGAGYWIAIFGGQTLLTGSVTWDPASVADGASVTTTVTVTGVTIGDFCLASFSLSLGALSMTAHATAVDTVTVVLTNNSGGPLDIASGTLKVRVLNQY